MRRSILITDSIINNSFADFTMTIFAQLIDRSITTRSSFWIFWYSTKEINFSCRSSICEGWSTYRNNKSSHIRYLNSFSPLTKVKKILVLPIVHLDFFIKWFIEIAIDYYQCIILLTQCACLIKRFFIKLFQLSKNNWPTT